MPSEIAIPARLSRRPRDSRGYPVPVTVLVDAAGKPDFKVTDIEKWVRAVQLRTCALCGDSLGRHLAFVGGPLAHTNRLFTDLPMHRDCAEYALRVCPFLAAPSFKYAVAHKAPEGFQLQSTELVSTTRPDRFFLGVTRNFRPVRTPDGHTLVQAEPWEFTQWWKNGEPMTEDPA